MTVQESRFVRMFRSTETASAAAFTKPWSQGRATTIGERRKEKITFTKNVRGKEPDSYPSGTELQKSHNHEINNAIPQHAITDVEDRKYCFIESVCRGFEDRYYVWVLDTAHQEQLILSSDFHTT